MTDKSQQNNNKTTQVRLNWIFWHVCNRQL